MSKSKNVVKKLTTILFTLVAIFAVGLTNVNAETTTTLVEDRDALVNAMNDKTTDIVRLNKNIELSSEYNTTFSIYKSKTLDLNGHTITVPDGKEINFWYYADADIKIMNSSNSSSAKIIGNHTGASTYFLLRGAIIRDAEKVNFEIDGVDFEVKNSNFTTIVSMKDGQKYENLIIKNSNVNGNQYLFWSGAAKKVYLESVTLKRAEGADRNLYRQLSNTSSLTVDDVIDANAVIEYYPSAGVKATADRTAKLNTSDLNAYWGPITVKFADGTPVVYTITFNSNGGTSVASQNVNAGEKLTEPTPAPTKEGFTFDGWYEDSTFSKEFDFNTPITDSMTLYAKWIENKYTVTFDANGGSGEMTPATDLTGEYTLPENGFTAPDGKKFKGWSLTKDGEIVTKVTMDKDVKVYAIWEAIPVTTYTLTFDANGGTGSMTAKTGLTGEYTLPANGFTAPSGKQFEGWSLTTDGTIVTKVAMTENRTVYAIWTNIGGGGGSSSGGGGGFYVPTTQKPEIKAAAGGKAELSKDGTTLTITADAGKVIDKVLLNGKDMGAASELKGLKTGDKVEVTFKDQVTEPTKEQLDKAAKEAAGDLVLAARSAKLKNGSVKIMLKGDLKAITDAGYTVKYKFYRSTKKSAGYKAVLTKKAPTYVNTYGKKGTMYYYKARVMIYDKDGNFVAQTALKQCKYANRLWTK